MEGYQLGGVCAQAEEKRRVAEVWKDRPATTSTPGKATKLMNETLDQDGRSAVVC